MTNSAKITAVIIAAFLSTGLFWFLEQPNSFGTLTLSTQLVSTSTTATTTLSGFSLRSNKAKIWEKIPLSLHTSTGHSNQANTSLPVGSYNLLRFSITAPEISGTSSSVRISQKDVTLPVNIDIKAGQETTVSLRIPLQQSLFGATDGGNVFLPRIFFKSTITKDAQESLLEMTRFGTVVDGEVRALFSYPQKTVFSVATDGSIEKAANNTDSASPSTSTQP